MYGRAGELIERASAGTFHPPPWGGALTPPATVRCSEGTGSRPLGVARGAASAALDPAASPTKPVTPGVSLVGMAASWKESEACEWRLVLKWVLVG